MTDGVKHIFVTLIKIPVIIAIVYLVFNVFTFCFTYFRLLGLSYVVMQTAVENNYIPPEEMSTLNEYLKSLEVSDSSGRGHDVFTDLYIEVDTVDASIDPMNKGTAENERVQYGTKIRVTVSGKYHFIWPLMPHEQLTDSSMNAVEGLYNQEKAGEHRVMTGEQIVNEMDRSKNNITIEYLVPGLKYYPDLQ